MKKRGFKLYAVDLPIGWDADEEKAAISALIKHLKAKGAKNSIAPPLTTECYMRAINEGPFQLRICTTYGYQWAADSSIASGMIGRIDALIKV